MTRVTFPKGFVWGSASSSYQIEGAWNEDDKGPSIWDTFTHQPGRIRNDENGDIAIDHYHLWKQDVRLMADLGFKTYRFSTSWPRIFPQGTGNANPKGVAFYDRLIDELLNRKLEPWLCLYHWDLPQALQDKGGWANRSITSWFADYAAFMAQKFGDRVKYWITHNEPAVTAAGGYLLGEHAPGIKDPLSAIKTLHYLLLSHGMAYQGIHANASNGVKVGIVLNLSPAYPATGSKKDVEAARRFDLLNNRSFLEPLLLGTSPMTEVKLVKALLGSTIQPGDAALIKNLDFLGVNYYNRTVVKHDMKTPILEFSQVHPPGAEYSGMWEIYPEGMFELLTSIWKRYGSTASPENPFPELYLTENGVPVPDGLDFDGRIRDERRIRYLHDHLFQVQRAIQAGVPVMGYFVWTLMDNFEWAHGYDMRFGLVHVDFKTQKRTVKDSGQWFSRVMQDNALD